MANEEKALAIRKTFTEAQWKEAKELITKSDKSVKEISEITGIPVTTIEAKATKLTWFNKRDKAGIEEVNENLHRVIQQVGFQVNDLHQHTVALTEALLKAYEIDIIRDNAGNIHYRNADNSGDKPPVTVWNTLSEEQKEAWYHAIAPMKFSKFIEELFKVQEMKMTNIEFITKMIKGSLPKIDPFVLDIGRRDSVIDVIDDTKLKDEVK